MPPIQLPRLKLGWPTFTVDLREPSHRLRLVLIVFGGLVAAVALSIGGVQAYQFTESPQFCGTLCHSMEPNYVRWEASPHASVACSECHVGPGFTAFVNSKIEGTRQLIDTILGTYARPIKSPVTNLRPARETCETCHTPSSFKDNVIKTIQSYDDDAQNTPIETTLILKMGGTNPATGNSMGIHWHTQGQVFYIALDDQRQTIAWIGVKQPDGSLKQYFSRDLLSMGPTAEAEFVQKARKAGQVRLMDCIDCHNRAAHYIPYPEQSVDQAIANGLISRNLPYIRSKAVALLSGSYADGARAFDAVDALKDYYQALPASGDFSARDVNQAVAQIKELYTETNFPDMNLNWRTNPNNEQHTPTLGCFRCHDGNHVSMDAQGNQQTISDECNLCHTVPIVDRGNQTVVAAPVLVGDPPASHKDFRWTIDHRYVTPAQEQSCYQCHGQAFCNNSVCH
ncbi:MAG TPA: NapC/NirT family cytochrome c, partial [Anaerolineales bacterium]|nr:NapC/NirT family cytochrome c [Anaerolineales bacterium]